MLSISDCKGDRSRFKDKCDECTCTFKQEKGRTLSLNSLSHLLV
uniref:Uncharacterized protein n=1 Tax=Anguilla anguilla TaxID=7936 RepID=A0A0E9QYF0_ANGAN